MIQEKWEVRDIGYIVDVKKEGNKLMERKMDKEEIKGLITLVVIIVVVFGGIIWLFSSAVSERESNEEFCADKLNVDKSEFSETNGNYYYKTIDNEHINCCKKGAELIDERYYKKGICRGFKQTKLNGEN